MPFNYATNPYVKLVETKPGLILAPLKDRPDPAFTAQVHEVVKQFPKVFIEIGSGSGGHIVERAAADPHNLYLGLELRYKRVFRTAEKAEERGIKNLRVLQLDANFLSDLFGPSSLNGIFVLFPDPWDKRRWRKHRILSEKNLALFEGMLQPGGYLHYKTDHHEYFEKTLVAVQSSTKLTRTFVTRDLYSETTQIDSIPSEFENLFRSKQLPIYMAFFEKK